MSDCKICKDKTENNNELCPKCKKRQKSAKIIIDIQNKVNFKNIITTKILYELGIKDEDLRTNIIYTLYETNMIEKINNTDYKWVNKEKITDFVKKYDINKGHDLNLDNKNIELNHNKCIYCNEAIQKPKTICKNCRKKIQTLKYINILNDFEETFNYNYLMEKVSQDEDDIKDLLYNLIEHDLIKTISEEQYQKLPKKIEEYIKENEKYSDEINKDQSKKIEEKKTNQNNLIQDNKSNSSETEPNTKNIIYNPNKPTQITDYKTTHKLIRKFLENHVSVLKRSARKKDVTIGVIYNTFKNFLIQDNVTIEFSSFINSFKLVMYDYNRNAKKIGINQIKTKYDGKHVHYNITLDGFYKNRKNAYLKIENSINFKIFNNFFETHLQISYKDKWIKKTELFQLFKEYASNKYDIEITETGRGGFDDIINFKLDEIENFTERIVNGDKEYNLTYVTKQKQENIINKTKEINPHVNTQLNYDKKSKPVVPENLDNKENNSKNNSTDGKDIDLTAEKNNTTSKEVENNNSEKSKNQKIDYDNNKIYEIVNIVNEALNKKIEDMNDKISSLENMLENTRMEKETKYSMNEKNLFELEKYLEISEENNYLTFQDLYHILNQLKLGNNNIYNDKDLKDFMSTFYEKNNLNIDEYIIRGKTFTYFMKISISNQNLINKITRELISNWISKNIVFSDNQQDKILFNDLIYEIVKSFKLENINKLYYNNISYDLEMVLVSFYENNNNKDSLKRNNNIICEGIKYQNEINFKEKSIQRPNEESIKDLTYDWLTENIIRTNDLNSKLALNDIYINIYPYLNDKNVSFKKTSLTREIGKSINIIFQGKNKIKREIVNNQTIYIGLQLKNPTMQENLTDSNQLSPKKPSELIEEWVDEKIQINKHNNKRLYMDKLISSFIIDLNYKNIEIEDSTGLRSNMSRILRKFYKQKTNKSIDTAQDEQLKRYFKHIEIKD